MLKLISRKDLLLSPRCFSCVLVLTFISVNGALAEDADDSYEKLYKVIMERKDSSGNIYGTNEVGPLIYGRSEFPFDRETYPRLKSSLERFDKLSRDQIKALGTVKRALLQRHLWTVFDATVPRDPRRASHMENRLDSRELVVRVMRRLALTSEEIKSLPDTRTATIKKGGFSEKYNPNERLKPFLPADLYAKESSWVCLGKVDYFDSDHASIEKWRSAFYQFVRLPGGREATEKYVKDLNDRKSFPVGTQFALIEQAFLINDKNEIILSPLVNSIQLRAYLNVTHTALQLQPKGKAVTCVSEFVIQPWELMKGKAVMRPLGPKEIRYQTAASGSGGLVDPFRDGARAESLKSKVPTMETCIGCHERSRFGVRSMGDFMFGDRAVDRLTFEIGHPEKIARGIAAIKQKNESWKTLSQLWTKAQ